MWIIAQKIAVQIPDTHHPYFDWGAWEAPKDFIRQHSSDISHIVFIGDIFNNSGISRHVVDDLIQQYENPIVAGFESFGRQLNEIVELAPNAKLVWVWGNHDDWLDRHVRKHPGFRGMLDQPLRLLREFGDCPAARKLKIVQREDPAEEYSIGKMYFRHGDTTAKHAADVQVTTFMDNITIGHTHTMQMTCISRRDGLVPMAGFTIGHMMSKDGRKYLKGRSHRWVTGFAALTYDTRTGYFNQHLLPITNGQCSMPGRVYGKKAA